MIDAEHFDQAMLDSARASTSDPTVTLADAGVDLQAVNKLIRALIPAYVGMTPGQVTAAAFASGVELGVRAARLHDRVVLGALLEAIADAGTDAGPSDRTATWERIERVAAELRQQMPESGMPLRWPGQ